MQLVCIMQELKVALGCATDKQLWFRIALISNNKKAATIFDDTRQACFLLLALTSIASPTDLVKPMQLPAHLLTDHQPDTWVLSTHSSLTPAAGADLGSGGHRVMRTGVAMKSTIMQVAAKKNTQVATTCTHRHLHSVWKATCTPTLGSVAWL
jgi:hypothetical protein